MGVPQANAKLISKVSFTLYMDRDCTKECPPIFPSPMGLRKTTQYPFNVEADAVIGTYTGNFSEVGYEVDFIAKWDIAVQKLFSWTTVHHSDSVKVWVKKSQVTFFGDDSPDAPKVDVPIVPVTKDNTNTYLALAIAAAVGVKLFRN